MAYIEKKKKKERKEARQMRIEGMPESPFHLTICECDNESKKKLVLSNLIYGHYVKYTYFPLQGFELYLNFYGFAIQCGVG